jgi:hypothetical protein
LLNSLNFSRKFTVADYSPSWDQLMIRTLSRRNFIRLSASAASAGILGWAGHAQVPGPSTSNSTRPRTGADFITRDTENAIREGLDYLARCQLPDGSFFQDREQRSGGASGGITSLTSLALMAAGNQPNRGKFGNHISRAVDYVVSLGNGPNRGFLTTRESQNVGNLATQPNAIYSHGFGTLFLSEVCGMLPATSSDNVVRAALEQAVAFTVSAQNNEGGWRYEPRAQFADVSVTVAQMMALRAAKHAGVMVRKSVIDAGAKYIKSCQLSDGGFSYWKGQGYSAFARSAACIVGLYSAGTYEGKEIEKGLKYLQQFTPGRQFSPRDIEPRHYWYGQYYAALAMWTAGDDYWTPWFPAIRDELLSKRRGVGGSWSDPYYGDAYATAMALIILQLPNNYLPILQK